MESVINYIFKQVREKNLTNGEAKALLNELQDSKKKVEEDIAIIGIGCKLPKADNPDEFWDNIENNENCITPFPENRKGLLKELNLDDFHTYGGYLDEIDKFDASFFRISPKEAKWMEPCQRLMLEIVCAAIEDSGYCLEKFSGSKTGVYLGHDHVVGKDYRQYCIDRNAIDPLVLTGTYPAILSRRISHVLNLSGPSIVIDCACSSGIAAVHTACEAIKNKECDMAIAGSAFLKILGINDSGLSVVESQNYLQRSFDNRSDGTIWGEGVGAIILKPVSKALKDRDHIYAVIKGSVLNNDGVSGGLISPNAKAQEELLESTWKKFNINPEDISYIEAHGTGTKIGDPMEIMAITNAFKKYTDKRQFCGIGSVKTNIGHAVSSAGIASIIKLALCLKKKKIPATINFNRPNRFIDFCDSPVYINDTLREWGENESPKIVGVNAFGFSGTNCHMILQEAPKQTKEKEISTPKSCIFTLSAKDKQVLIKLVDNYIKSIDTLPEVEFEDMCYTANTGRGHYEYRIAIIANNKTELKEKLLEIMRKGSDNIEDRNVYYGTYKIVNRIEDSEEDIGLITKGQKSKRSSMANKLLSEKIDSNESWNEILQLAAQHYVNGADIMWEETIFRGGKRNRVSLPTYPFKRESFWSSIENSYSIEKCPQNVVNEQNTKKDGIVHKNIKLSGRKKDEEYSKAEWKLAQIWSEILGYDEINIHDSFFEIGGDSISLMQMINAIQAEFGVSISYNRFVEEGCIIKLAEMLPDCENGTDLDKYFNWEPDRENMYKPFPMTDVQLAYLTGRDSMYELGGVVTYVYSDYKTKLDIGKLNYSLNKVVQRHPMLHTVFLDDARQRILEDIPEYKIEVVDISTLSEREQERIIFENRQKYSHYFFDPHQWPLFLFKVLKLADGLYQLYVGFDMLVADETSLQLIARDMIHYYQNPEEELQRIDFTFRDYIMAHYEFKKSETYEAAKKYWLEKLEDFPTAPVLPLKGNAEDIDKPQFKRCHRMIDKDILAKLRIEAQRHNVSLSTVLCTAYAEVLAYWSNQYRLAINLTVFNRPPFNKQIYEIVGDFTSVMLLEIDLKPDTSFWDRAKSIQKVMMEALEHRYYDGVEFIREISKAKSFGNKAVMPIVFTSMISGNNEKSEQSSGSWNQLGELEMSASQTPQVYIDNQAIEVNGDLSLTWDYVQQLFEENLINTMFEQYTHIIAGLICQEEDYKLSLTCSGMEFINEYNSTFEDIPVTTLPELFIRQAKRTPGNIAVEFLENKLTYEQLNNMSNQVAHYLKDQEIVCGSKVAVSVSRCEMTIVNILGILKSGAAYVPLEPDYPQERKDYIINNSRCNMFLDLDFYHTKNLKEYCLEDICLSNADDIAYIIYTSGSTGKPKGVIIKHKSVANTIIDINQKFGVNEKDRILGLSSMCFDLSVYDIFGALSTGAALVIIPDQRDVRCLIDAVENKNITIWNSVPSIMEMLVDNMQDANTSNKEYKVISESFNTEKSILVKVQESDEKERFYWSPVFQWRQNGETLEIGNFSYSGVASMLFPKFYFIMQEGCTVEALLKEFPDINKETIVEFVDELVRNRILVNRILYPDEVFLTQQHLFKNKYSDEIIYNPVEMEKYKLKQLSRVHWTNGNKIIIPEYDDYCAEIAERRTVRVFNENEQIPFERFAKMLSILRQKNSENNIYYYYASAGGLYPIDVFIYIKHGRVEGMKEGLYYYSPIDNSLTQITDTMDIQENWHYFSNKSIFKSSAFSMFFVYNAEANMPKYGSRGYFYACLDAGIMISTINYAAELAKIGLCSIGNMNYSKIEKYFGFNENQVLIHSIEGGLKNEKK